MAFQIEDLVAIRTVEKEAVGLWGSRDRMLASGGEVSEERLAFGEVEDAELVLEDDSGAFGAARIGYHEGKEVRVVGNFVQHPRCGAERMQGEGHLPATVFGVYGQEAVLAVAAREGGTVVTVEAIGFRGVGKGGLDGSGGSSIENLLEGCVGDVNGSSPFPCDFPWCGAGVDFPPTRAGSQGDFSQGNHDARISGGFRRGSGSRVLRFGLRFICPRKRSPLSGFAIELPEDRTHIAIVFTTDTEDPLAFVWGKFCMS